jgi:hypothetical protein
MKLAYHLADAGIIISRFLGLGANSAEALFDHIDLVCLSIIIPFLERVL